MMDRTDRHFRYMTRGISRCALLYTEMLTTGAILHGDRERFLAFSPEEKPLALQLGGDDPRELAECARLGEAWGYDEINLNVGCPSDRVQKGRFGACLMRAPERVAEAVAAMRDATRLPVTVKHRIGVDEADRYDDMRRFVDVVSEAGCDRFSVHARKAWLSGLSAKENREIPPLRYEDVHRLKRERPELIVEINGGLRTLDDVRGQLDHVDAAMVGRAAWDEPFSWRSVDRVIFGHESPAPTRRDVVEWMLPYVERCRRDGIFLSHVTRPMLSLMSGVPGARAWRRCLSEGARFEGAGPELVREALRGIPDEALDAA
jgi:tRNA-dihydrouridine synthase A